MSEEIEIKTLEEAESNNPTSQLREKPDENFKEHGHSHDDGHGHSHDDGHGHKAGHKHGKSRKKDLMQNKGFNIFIVAFTIGMPTNCVILEYFWFDEELKANPFEYYFQTSFLFFIYFMSCWSYYQAATIKNDLIQRPPPAPDTRDIDPIYKNSESCKVCNKWKPVRAHHCSICKKCVLKMDHHCPWVVNCVGLRNHRAFWLFTLYLLFGGWQYVWRSCSYFKLLYYSPNFFIHDILFYVYWTLTSIVLFPTSVLLITLLGYHSMLIISNMTTLETMANGNQGFCPCLESGNKKPTFINVFDRGLIANTAWFFEYSLFTWWMPFANTYENDGTQYAINPLCTFQDIQIAQGNLNISDMTEQLDLEKINIDFETYVAEARAKYKGRKIMIDNQVIEIE